MSKGIESLARQVAAKGRGGDSALLHIHPSELKGMEAILRQLDPEIRITLNPETGMYEAFSWKKLLGAIGLGAAAAGLTIFTGGAAGGPAAKMFGAGMSSLLKTVALPAAIAGATGLAAGAVAPNQKKSNQQQLSDARKYIEGINEREYARQRFAIPGVAQLNQAPAQQQPQQQGQGIGAVLPMGTPLFNFRQALATPAPPAPSEDDETRSFAEGGSLEPEEEKAQEIIRRAMEAIRGEGEDPEGALNIYIAYYGKDALQDLHKRMSGEEAPEEESESPEGLIKGPGNGMDDMATARMARGGQKVLLSNDEFIIPADVVSGLGDGSSEAGARKLYAMMDRVRKDRTGTTKQPGKVKDSRVLPV
jgi:hypothetical protein